VEGQKTTNHHPTRLHREQLLASADRFFSNLDILWGKRQIFIPSNFFFSGCSPRGISLNAKTPCARISSGSATHIGSAPAPSFLIKHPFFSFFSTFASKENTSRDEGRHNHRDFTQGTAASAAQPPSQHAARHITGKV
jgi:hypothetical protein